MIIHFIIKWLENVEEIKAVNENQNANLTDDKL